MYEISSSPDTKGITTLHVSRTASFETTLVRLSVRPSVSSSVTKFSQDCIVNFFWYCTWWSLNYMVLTRMLDSLAGCLMELCASDFYWTFFFISALSDILASLLISRVFIRVFQADENPECLNMFEFTITDRGLNIYHTINSTRSVYKLMGTYWGVLRTRSKI